MEVNHVESNYASTWLENGVVYQVIKPNFKTCDILMAKQLVEDRIMASKGTVCSVIVILSNILDIDKETRQYYATGEPYRNITAIAMIMDNYVVRLLGDLVYFLNKPPVPITFFKDKKKALKWLEEYKLEK